MGKKITQEEFILKAVKVHGDAYDYSLVEYVNTTTKVNIVCKKHGVFPQTPNNHTNGNGCPKCAEEHRADRNRKDINHFLSRSMGVHGDKYDYSKVEYIRENVEVEILCPVHGSFWQTPNAHYAGKGCRLCHMLPV